MKFRKLRIAWSVTWGVLAVALCLLWVRSYWWRDPMVIGVPTGRWIHIISMHGGASIAYVSDSPFTNTSANPTADYVLGRSLFTEVGRSERIPMDFGALVLNPAAFRWDVFDDGVRVILPYWCMVLTSIGFAIAPWIAALKCRFSLRTLLIATTLVAFGLGLVVYFVRG
jgi:hypothetical protein